jgi:ribulose-5-phosphate 4-epimerase/fuculose-1-phosphate aldolase
MKHFLKPAISITVILVVSLLFAMCDMEDEPVVTVSPATLSLNVGEYAQLIAQVAPADAGNKALTWTSGNPGIATVDENGNVKAVKTGSVTITATLEDGSGAKGTSTITVEAPAALTFTDDASYDIPALTVGMPITPVNVSGAVSGGTKPYTFMSNGLPDGISISTAGVISGTPTTAAAGTATVIVTDAAEYYTRISYIAINFGTFTEYSLTGTMCDWKNITADEVVVVNSDEELQNYISGTDYPPVDFSKHTLVMATGETPVTITAMVYNFRQLSTNKYELYTEVILGDGMTFEDWRVAILVDKLSDKADIDLDVNVVASGLHVINGESWRFGNLPIEDVVLVNNNEELQNYISGTDYPHINFSEYTLILASGTTAYEVNRTTCLLIPLSTDKYELYVRVVLGNDTVDDVWLLAILVDKLSNNTDIDLNLNIIL